MSAALLGGACDGCLLDTERLRHCYRARRGVEVNEETLGIDAIRQAVLGEGHFLGGAQTMAAMERDYYYPPLADRDPPITWSEEGRKTAWQRANRRAKEILAKPGPDYLAAEEEKAIRAAFDIRLGVEV
jgi:trimethylamine--corrinoid protein Co-methyltransferase